jgi:hypothetical protein
MTFPDGCLASGAPGRGIDRHFVAGMDEPRHVAGEAIDQAEPGEGGALRQDRIDAVEHQPQRREAARLHLGQHPGAGDAALGLVENQDTADIALSGELVRGPAEDPLVAVEIVARAEIVGGDEGRAARRGSDAGMAGEHDRHHTIRPATAESRQRSRFARLGR